jgi:hypothetical protein
MKTSQLGDGSTVAAQVVGGDKMRMQQAHPHFCLKAFNSTRVAHLAKRGRWGLDGMHRMFRADL